MCKTHSYAHTHTHTHTYTHTHAPLSDYLISNLFASTLIYSSNRKINRLQFSFLIKDIILFYQFLH